MNPTNPNTSRAIEIWKRFVGMFGADSVLRKFGDEPPLEWVVMIQKLRDFEVDRGLRRLVYGGKPHVPTLPEFVKLCRTIGVAEDVDDGPKPAALPNPEAWKGDHWDVEANHHLRAHLMRRMQAKPRCYGRPASYLAMQGSTRETSPNADASPEFIRAVHILRDYKKAWARDMREGNVDPSTGEVTPPSLADQKAAWEDCMQRAEAAIAQQVAA
jgi:hypothetical protein